LQATGQEPQTTQKQANKIDIRIAETISPRDGTQAELQKEE
jgi:hypothetical protein